MKIKTYVFGALLFAFVFSFTAYAEEAKVESYVLGLGESYKIAELKQYYEESKYDKNIITLDEEGKVTAVATGETYISGSQGKLCRVTVKKAPSKVSLNRKKVTMGVGEIFNFNSSVPEGSASKKVKYTCDSDILKYLGSGKFEALGKGTATVTATTYNGKSVKATVTVKKAPKKISLAKTEVILGVGESYTFEPELDKGSASDKITYSLSKKSVLKKKSSGTYVAKKVGKVTVTLKTFNGKKVKCTVTVKKLPSRISVSSKSYSTLTIGKSKTVKVKLPENTACNTYTYKSSKPSVVSVSSKGKLTAKKIGTAKITVISLNKKKTTFTVKVKAMNLPFVNQFPKYPTGCEAACCTSILRYYGYDISLDKMVSLIPSQKIKTKKGKRIGPDINESFVGDPMGAYTSDVPGYGIFSPGVAASLQKAIDLYGGKHKAEKLNNCTWKKLLSEVSKGNPVIVWATYQMIVPQTVNSWYIPQKDGSLRYFEYPRGTHVMILTGYSSSSVTVLDPAKGVCTFDREVFESRWNLLGNQAVVIRK